MKKLLISIFTILLISTGLMAQVTVTFKVNITDYLAAGNTLGAGGMRVGGNFSTLLANSSAGTMPDWTPSNPNCALTDIGNNVWSIDVTYPASSIGTTQQYKFVNNDWGTNEGTDPANTIASGGCGVDDGAGNINRTLVVPSSNTEFCYMWDACSPCGAPPQPAVVTTDSIVSNIGTTTARVNGLVSGSNITIKGFCYGITPNPSLANSVVNAPGQGPGNFFFNLSGLLENTIYYVKAYAINAAGISFGNEISFRTFATADFAIINTTPASNITDASALSGGNVTYGGTTPVTARGVCWSTSPNPTVLLSTKTLDSNGIGAFSSNITGLGPGLKFYLRAYATNSAGTSYGAMDSLNTTGTALQNIQVIYKVDISNYLTAGNSLGSGKMRIGGNFADFGAKRSDSLMVNWTPSNVHSKMDSLDNNIWAITVTYPTNASGSDQIFKFVNNDWGTNEGTDPNNTIGIGGCGIGSGGNVNRLLTIPFTNKEICFKWDACVNCGISPGIPTASTSSASNITDSSATVSGTANGVEISSRGFCYSLTPNPTISDSVVLAGQGSGIFNATLSGLLPDTMYYVRAFAKNLGGVSYGDTISFKTLQITTRISQTFNSASLKLLPNPSNNKVQFSGLKSSGELVLMTIHGKEVIRKSIQPGGYLDIHFLSSSTYFYTIQTNEGVYRGKLIRE